MKMRFDENCLVHKVDWFFVCLFVFVLRCMNDVAVFIPYAAHCSSVFCFLT